MNIFKYKHFIKPTKRKKQVAALFSVNIISIPLGIISNMIITRYLGAEKYGDLSFILSIFNVAIILFNFGIFQSGNRAIVLTDDKRVAKEYYGAILFIMIIIFIIMSIGLLTYAYYDKNIIAKGLQSFFLRCIPFSWLFLLQKYFEVLFQADNRIKELALVRLVPKIFYLFFAILIYFGFYRYDLNKLNVVWYSRIISFLLPFMFLLYLIKPNFSKLGLRIKDLWIYNKSYGMNVYIGSLADVGFNSITGILISYFSNSNAGVGFFGLATTLSMPLSLVPNVIATTHYKDFSKQKSIPKKLTYITITLTLVCLLLVRIIIGPFIRIFYGLEFTSVVELNFLISIGVLLHGFGDYFNRFLGAHGEGKALRNSSVVVGFALLFLNLILIPRFGEKGAAITKILSGGIYFSTMALYYKKKTKSY